MPRRVRPLNGRSPFFLGDDISVDSGVGTVTNMGTLRLAALQTITGSFTQIAAGVLGLDFAGDASGQYGALSVTKLTTLDGGLAIDLTGGFTLATGDSFDILGLGSLAGPGFDALALDGAACSSKVTDIWSCGGRRVSERSDRPHVAGPRCGPRLGPYWGLRARRRSPTLDLGDDAARFLGLGGLGLKGRRRAALS